MREARRLDQAKVFFVNGFSTIRAVGLVEERSGDLGETRWFWASAGGGGGAVPTFYI